MGNAEFIMEATKAEAFVSYPDYRGKPALAAPDVAAWRQWLALNHASAQGCWLVMFKKESGQPSIYYTEAVDEALCWGWIDSVPNKRDDLSYIQYFAPRKPRSAWSKVNKEKLERVIAEGRMQPAGWASIERAKALGSWTLLDTVEELIAPEELEEAFALLPQARVYWEAFPRTVKRAHLEWIAFAKRPETRAQRIENIVSLAALNRRARFEQ